jgi:hypothetical protein
MASEHATVALHPTYQRTYTREELTHLWQRAHDRAVAERTRAWSSSPLAWTVMTQLNDDDGAATRYTVVVIGPRPFDTVCPCPAGEFGAPCKHRATVAYARAAGVDRVIMAPEPATAAAHCIRCHRWFAVLVDTELRCPTCR